MQTHLFWLFQVNIDINYLSTAVVKSNVLKINLPKQKHFVHSEFQWTVNSPHSLCIQHVNKNVNNWIKDN